MKTANILLVIICSALPSCAPMVTTTLVTTFPPAGEEEQIKVLGLDDEIPVDAILLGTVKVGDNGFSANCGFREVLALAKKEAQKAGGNAIRITRHIPPGRSTCHRITAQILKTFDGYQVESFSMEPESIRYAVFNIYCDPNATGAVVPTCLLKTRFPAE
ncbi:MAG: hypothetical protein R2764_23755 [Bacteroidales bacterium]